MTIEQEIIVQNILAANSFLNEDETLTGCCLRNGGRVWCYEGGFDAAL